MSQPKEGNYSPVAPHRPHEKGLRLSPGPVPSERYSWGAMLETAGFGQKNTCRKGVRRAQGGGQVISEHHPDE